jgi:hypothetical protein
MCAPGWSKGYNRRMGFRVGVVVGFAGGFYLGAKAGRERYHQMNRMIRRAKGSDAVDAVADRAKAVVGSGVDRAMEAAGERFGREPDPTDLTGVRLAPTTPGVDA